LAVINDFEDAVFIPGNVCVKKAGPDQAGVVAEILADAFNEDPVMTWICPDPEYPKWAWPLALPFFLPHNEVYVTEDGLGAALWLPPGVELRMSPSLAVLWDAWDRFGLGSIFRYFKFISTLTKHHPKDRHYYLFAIGVRCGSRGRGVGSALLRHVLHKCDQESVGAYLENSNEHNVSFYRGHGFETTDEIALPRNGPSIWLMYRQPLSG
jgi:ribosomal protein S18 acetylase RimI-like enzyme